MNVDEFEKLLDLCQDRFTEEITSMKILQSIYGELPPLSHDVVLLLMILGDDSSAKYFASTKSEKKDMLEQWREGKDSLFVVFNGEAFDPEAEEDLDYLIQGMKELGCES